MKLKQFALPGLLILIALVAVACDIAGTGDKSTDAAAAQQFIPHPDGYAEYGTENIQDSISNTLAGAGILTGNPIQGILVNQVDSFINCYRDVGAFDARIHVKNVNLDSLTPVAGVVGVINQSRIIDNFLSCASPLSGQSADEIQPCSGGGTFTAEGDTFYYIYAATGPELCGLYANHFRQYPSGG